ncbi:hypothetical protein SAMN04487760_101390 [Lachnospiraceae bacterium G41]|nr:hypothetical protein SAMN04487760_101390 [Lachnospiraceae bacterium G41]
MDENTIIQNEEEQVVEETAANEAEQAVEETAEAVEEKATVEEKPAEEKPAEEKKAEEPKPAKKKKTKLFVVIGIALAALALLLLVVIVVVVIIVAIALHKPTIDMNQYISLDTQGYDGYGTAAYVFDSTTFMEDNADKFKFTSKFKREYNNADSGTQFLIALSGIDINNDADAAKLFVAGFNPMGELSECTRLSNNDVITYTWTFGGMSEEEVAETCSSLGVKLNYSDIEFTVEDLEPVAYFDPFDGITIDFTGISPAGQAVVNNMPNNGLYYTLDRMTNLSNGEEIVMTATTPYGIEAYIQAYGKAPTSESKSFVVEGLGEYISSASMIPEEELEKMKKQASDTMQSNSINTALDSEAVLDVEYIGTYFLTAKDLTTWDFKNKVCLVYRMHYTKEVKDHKKKDVTCECDFYNYVSWENMYVDSDGNFIYDLNNYEKPWASDSHKFDVYQTSLWGILGNQVIVYYNGFSDLDSLSNNVVTSNLENYTPEENISQEAIEYANQAALEEEEESEE